MRRCLPPPPHPRTHTGMPRRGAHKALQPHPRYWGQTHCSQSQPSLLDGPPRIALVGCACRSRRRHPGHRDVRVPQSSAADRTSRRGRCSDGQRDAPRPPGGHRHRMSRRRLSPRAVIVLRSCGTLATGFARGNMPRRHPSRFWNLRCQHMTTSRGNVQCTAASVQSSQWGNNDGAPIGH